MDSSGSDQDVPQRVLDMVRMFLASSTRGDHTVLTLETRNQQIVTKYRSVVKRLAVSLSIQSLQNAETKMTAQQDCVHSNTT